MNEWIQPSIMEGEIEREDTDVRDNIKFLVKSRRGWNLGCLPDY